jgi:hypothetical protein
MCAKGAIAKLDSYFVCNTTASAEACSREVLNTAHAIASALVFIAEL